MSLSPHQRGNISNIVKQNIEAIEEPTQHSGEVFYNVGAPSLQQTHSSAGGSLDPNLSLQNSAAFKPEKGYQVWGHFQQSGPVKWVRQDPIQTSSWFQGVPNPAKLPQDFGPSLSGIDDTRGTQALHKTSLDMDALQQDKMSAGSSVPYPEPSQALPLEMEWEHHTMAAMHQSQFQALQQGLKSSDPQYQAHPLCHAMTDSSLQPFPLAFGPTKQSQASGFFQGFHSNSAAQNLGYSEQPKTQQQLMQQHQHQMQQRQQAHQLQQQQHQLHQLQQQQRLHHMQQQYHSHQKLQEHLQQIHQQQQLQQQLQGMQQPELFTAHAHQQDQRLARPQQLDDKQLKANAGRLSDQSQPTVPQPQTHEASAQSPLSQDPGPGKGLQVVKETHGKPEALPRRSRRLSKDGVSPQGNQPPKEPARNGGMGGVHGPPGSVIQSTRRRRASKEINLETLAQKASEMEFLPAKSDESALSKQAGVVPLVIPVSVPVPVRRGHAQTDQAQWGAEPPPDAPQHERKPSVIVARRRSLRNSVSDTFNQDEEKEDGRSSDKIKRRPRPEPLVIPPHKSCTFIVPSIYSSITPYQSHLRSPGRLPDHTQTLPPYTPPPILSPVREGSGLYFSTFLSSIAAGSQGLPPSTTPKIASRSFLQTSSSDITPPVLPLIGEATPASLEPRINIGSQYQAMIPDLQDLGLAQEDEHKARLVWHPLPEHNSSCFSKEKVDDLVNVACSSVMCGGGTNVELMHHCLHDNKGDVMKTLEQLLMKNPVFSESHHLANYHYAGSDYWTAEEKCYFNKGISAYRKDFLLVQKLIRSKTVAQCVEFYYTYKKQVRIGRNGSIIFGHLEPEEKSSEITLKQEGVGEPEESKQKRGTDAGNVHLKPVTQTLHTSENEGNVLLLSNPKIGSVKEAAEVRQEGQTPPSAVKPRPESAAKRSKPSAVSKSQGEPEGIFPCKKCSRVFYKVKSRSAHMKSHAEQEKKAAAQRQREEEERAAMKARQEAAGREDSSDAEEGGAKGGAKGGAEWDDDWC